MQARLKTYVRRQKSGSHTENIRQSENLRQTENTRQTENIRQIENISQKTEE